MCKCLFSLSIIMLIPSLHIYYLFLCYYGLVRLLAKFLARLGFYTSLIISRLAYYTYLFKVLQDLLGIVNISLLCSPHPKTPTGPIFPRHFVHMLLFATREIVSTPAYQIYGAQQFHAFALRLSYSPIYA